MRADAPIPPITIMLPGHSTNKQKGHDQAIEQALHNFIILNYEQNTSVF
jgi:hypothetical protein